MWGKEPGAGTFSVVVVIVVVKVYVELNVLELSK
jgi:hypothetical protein